MYYICIIIWQLDTVYNNIMFENISVLLFSQQLSVSSTKDPFGNLFTVSGIVKTDQIYPMSPSYELLGVHSDLL